MMKTFQFSAILFTFAIANINCQFSPPDGWTPPPKSSGWTPPPKSSGWTPPSGSGFSPPSGSGFSPPSGSGFTPPSGGGGGPPSKATTTTETPVIVGLHFGVIELYKCAMLVHIL